MVEADKETVTIAAAKVAMKNELVAILLVRTLGFVSVRHIVVATAMDRIGYGGACCDDGQVEEISLATIKKNAKSNRFRANIYFSEN